MRLQVAAVLLALTLAGPAVATATTAAPPRPSSLTTPAGSAAGSNSTAKTVPPTTSTSSEAPVPVPASDIPPAGRRLSSARVLAIARALPKMKAVRAKYPGSYDGAYLKGAFRWQVSFFSKKGAKEIGQVIVDDASGRVLEQWTGFQVAWTMARGYPGAFGEHVNALYIWLPLCVLFFVPFFDWRRPFSLLHLDLLALLSFSVSLAFFNHAHIYASVPLVYPPLLYLLARMLALLRRGARPPAMRLLVPTPWLAIGVVFLIGFRIGLNVTDGNVIDVGYAGVIGAERIVHGKSLYGAYPSDNEHGDTYGPVNYAAYVPFEQILGWNGTWDDLPAAHAAAITFDLLAIALLFLIGRRVRGPSLGIVLAYAWVSYPFTLFALESDSNDTLVAVLVLAALLCASYRSSARSEARSPRSWVGAFAAFAGLTKFAPLALVPLLATHGLGERGRSVISPSDRLRPPALFALVFIAAGALASIPALRHDTLHTIYERTVAYQANRGSPFSVWGLYGALHGLQTTVLCAAVLLAVALALVPRRSDPIGLAAACAAVLIALQLGIEHWFYLYIPWFFPLAAIALLGGHDAQAGDGDYGGAVKPDRREAPPAWASEPARSSPLGVLPSSG